MKCLVEKAREEAAQGQARTADSEGQRVLNELSTKHATDLAALPGVKDAINLRMVPDLVEIPDADPTER